YSETVEQLVSLQREEFILRKNANDPLPHLVNSEEGLLPTGKMTRFVEINS
ncbi:MAG: hypothetical protein JWO78_1106, partial [Micavibrio sp.]|nr:hypothetical protein [Micavibrio sp.]